MASERKQERKSKTKITKSERDILMRISEEFERGQTDTYRELMYPEYKEIPVDIATFITSKRYLGSTYINEDGSCSMYPFWWDWITSRKEEKRITCFSGSTGCVSGDTEFFNGRYWIKIKNYRKGMRVLQWNPFTNIANLVFPMRYIITPVTTINVLHSKKGISQEITDDHKFVYERNRRLGYVQFSDIKERIKKGNLDGNILSTFRYNGQGIDKSDEEIKHQIEQILDSRKGQYLLDEFWWRADASQQMLIKDEIDKRLRNRCLNTCKSMVYATTDERRADFVQWIYTTQGQKSTINKVGNQYRVSVSKNGKSRIYASDVWRGEYEDVAYCFEVPSGHLVLRKNGRIFITSNCGKTSIACTLFLYDLYRMMCLKNPRQYYRLSGKKHITFSVINPLGLVASRENAWGIIQGMVQSSPWFMSHGYMTGNVYPTWHPKGEVSLSFGSQERHLTGRDICSVIMDEISEQTGDLKKQQQKALRLLTTARERQSSRFPRKENNPTRVYLASSKKTEDSFMENYVKEQEANDNEQLEVIDRPRWEILPPDNFDWSRKIYVGMGNASLPNILVGYDGQKKEQIEPAVRDAKAQGYNILEMPYSEDFIEACQNDIDMALTNIAGISVSNAVRYISGARWADCEDPSIRRPFAQEVYTIGTRDDVQYADMFEDVYDPQIKRKKMYIDMDTSFAKDKTGISMVTIDRIEKNGDEKIVYYRNMFTVYIQAPRDAEISFEKNIAFVRALKKKGFRIAAVGMDTFNSKHSQQILEAEGYNVVVNSVDRVDKNKICEPYLALKNAINARTIITAPYKLLSEELVGLERDNNTGKIDHSPSGINCFVGDTKVSLVDGREVTFFELLNEYQQGKENYVYTIDRGAKRIVPKRIKKVWCSGHEAKVVRVTLDNGESIVCTPEHLFMLRDGNYEQAQNLRCGDSLMPLYRKHANAPMHNYRMYYEPFEDEWHFEHRRFVQDEKGERTVVHHKDAHAYNNSPSNLMWVTKAEHQKIHALMQTGAQSIIAKEKRRESVKRSHQVAKTNPNGWVRYYSGTEEERRIKHAAVLEAESRKLEIIDKINEYFGIDFDSLDQSTQRRYRAKWANLVAGNNVGKELIDHARKASERRELGECACLYYGEDIDKLSPKERQGIIIKYLNETKEGYKENIALKISENHRLGLYENAHKAISNRIWWTNGVDNVYIKSDVDPPNGFWRGRTMPLKNHKVIKVETLEDTVDVYDMEVEDNHNFALTAGVFVHNSKDGADSLAGALFLAQQNVEEFLHEYGYSTARLTIKANASKQKQAAMEYQENQQRFSASEIARKIEEVRSDLVNSAIKKSTPDNRAGTSVRQGKRIFVK